MARQSIAITLIAAVFQVTPRTETMPSDPAKVSSAYFGQKGLGDLYYQKVHQAAVPSLEGPLMNTVLIR
jgi:hypothetical protein